MSPRGRWGLGLALMLAAPVVVDAAIIGLAFLAGFDGAWPLYAILLAPLAGLGGVALLPLRWWLRVGVGALYLAAATWWWTNAIMGFIQDLANRLYPHVS